MPGAKTLPINLNLIINSECGIFYHASIIECLPYGMEWLTTHISMMTKSDGEITIGVDERPFMVEHFSEILDTDYIDYEDVAPERVVQTVRNLIDDGCYAYVFMNTGIAFQGQDRPNPFLHDYVVYGYDDEEQLFKVAALFSTGVRDVRVTYDNFRNSYEYIVRRLKDNPSERFDAFFAQYYVITYVKPRDYRVRNKKYIHDAMRVLKYYLIGKKLTVHDYADRGPSGEKNADYTQYSGIGVIKGMAELIDKYEADHIVWRGISRIDKSAKRILEMHELLLNLLQMLADKADLHSGVCDGLIEQYRQLTRAAKKCHLLAMKFVIDKNERTLFKIRDMYESMFADETQTLSTLYGHVYERLLTKPRFD